MGSFMFYKIGDLVWVQTTEYSASRAEITGLHSDGYYVKFMDKTNDQPYTESYPVMERSVQPIDYVGWEK